MIIVAVSMSVNADIYYLVSLICVILEVFYSFINFMIFIVALSVNLIVVCFKEGASLLISLSREDLEVSPKYFFV